MTTEAARIAFVGAGNHGTQSLYPNIAHLPEFDLIAVCDLDAEKARYAARKFGAPAWYTDVETLLERERPQGVCVCGPAAMHVEVGRQVLRRGIPLFTEKPPGSTLAEAQSLVDLARETKTWGMVAFMKRFAPANVVAKEHLQSDAFGPLTSLTMIHGCGPYDDLRKMLLFNGIHMLDLGRFLAGDVVEVFAHHFTGGALAQAVSVSMRFTGGVVGQLNLNSGRDWSNCSEQAYLSGANAEMLIDASRAVEVMSPAGRFARGEGLELFGWSSRYSVSGNMAGWAAGGHYTRGYWGELQHFARAILGQVEPLATLEDGMAAMKLIDAIVESAATGQPVKL
ncbi:MAG: Gfo/Idh/MocA family protein [Armatimonadota bacterium]